jgi:hypothetical protein
MPPSATSVTPTPPRVAPDVTWTASLNSFATKPPLPGRQSEVKLTWYSPGARPVSRYPPPAPVTARPAIPRPLVGVASTQIPGSGAAGVPPRTVPVSEPDSGSVTLTPRSGWLLGTRTSRWTTLARLLARSAQGKTSSV